MVKYEMPYEEDALTEIINYNNKYIKNYTNNYVVEIGCSYNSWFLNEPLRNLRGIRIDSDMNKIINYGSIMFPFKSICKKVSANNICKILEDNNVPEDFFMLCIDIDGPDYFVVQSILKKYRPKIIVTEYNEAIPYPAKFAVKAIDNFTWIGGRIYGYSIACIEDIMNLYNYTLDNVIVNNLFLTRIDNDETPNIDEIEQLYNDGYLFSKKYSREDKTLFTNEYNENIQYLQNYKIKEEIAIEFRKHLLENPINPYNGKYMLANIDNYIMNDEYEEYLREFLQE